jgi:DNA-binding response OmpR family regulator
MPRKILVVDDEPETLRLVGLALHHAGYEVLGAQSGAEALLKIAQDRPDLVILDVMLPGMSGYEVCQRIRESPDTADLPVIMLSALSGMDEKITGFRKGADDYLAKPVALEELIVRVQAVLARASHRAPPPPPPQRARILAFVGVKGGVGTTTLAVNTALVAVQDGKDTILLDLHPQGGTVAAQLGHQPRRTLSSLIEDQPETIEPTRLQGCLLTHETGLRVLPASLGPAGQPRELTEKQIETMLKHLGGQADLLILDLEPALSSSTGAALRQANHVVLVSESDAIALKMTREWLRGLDGLGIGGGAVSIVVVNRSKADTALSRTEIEQTLEASVLALIIPAPEICLYANKIGRPILLHGRDTPTEQQLRAVAQRLTQ